MRWLAEHISRRDSFVETWFSARTMSQLSCLAHKFAFNCLDFSCKTSEEKAAMLLSLYYILKCSMFCGRTWAFGWSSTASTTCTSTRARDVFQTASARNEHCCCNIYVLQVMDSNRSGNIVGPSRSLWTVTVQSHVITVLLQESNSQRGKHQSAQFLTASLMVSCFSQRVSSCSSNLLPFTFFLWREKWSVYFFNNPK